LNNKNEAALDELSLTYNSFLNIIFNTMILTEKDIDKIAELAHLKPTLDEKKRLLVDLNNILKYMEIIEEADIENIHEIQLGSSKPTPLRNDTVKLGLSQKDALLNASQSRDGLFAVPKFVKESDNRNN